MRIPLFFVLLCALAFAGCASQQTSKTAAKPRGKHMKVRTTAYTHTEAGGRNNAIGTRLRFGGSEYSAAADWSWMPLGTRFRCNASGRIYVVEDYGSALVNRQTVDLYVPSMREVNRWGVRYLDIEILDWGSKAMSLKMLEPRARNRHVAVMVAQLREQGVRPGGPS